MPKRKTMHELAKEFPNKTYRELEKYRDADRQEEAAQIPITESQKLQEELEPIPMPCPMHEDYDEEENNQN